MGTVKLTNWIRGQITRDLLAHRFNKACDELVADRATFALKLYNDSYSAALRKKMADLPNGWLPMKTSIGVQFGGGSGYEEWTFGGATHGPIGKFCSKPIEHVEHRFLSRDYRGCLKVYDLDHALAIAGLALKGRREDLVKQIEAAERQADSALSNITTIGRLVEIWPEVEPFATKHETTRVPLPALPTADLNRLLDLPIAEAA